MKTIKLLFAACAALFLAQGAFAAKEAKAVLTDSGKTLKFVYDEADYGKKDTAWFSVSEAVAQEQKSSAYKPWRKESVYNVVTKVVFDPSFGFYKPTNCYQWFRSFSVLTTVVGIENLDVSAATNLGMMFAYCSQLQTLDLSQFDTANVTSIYAMFNGCSALTTIYASEKFVTTGLTTPTEQVFDSCMSLVGGNDTAWNSSNRTADYAKVDEVDYPGYFTLKKPTVVWDDSNSTLTFYFEPALKLPPVSSYPRYDFPENDGDMPKWIEKVATKVKKVVIDSSFATCRPSCCYAWFYTMANMTEITGLNYLNVSKVTDSFGLRMMFSGCSKVTKLDLSSFDTANVPKFQGMFEGCSALTTIYATEKFVVKSTASSPDMFANCNSLKGGNGTTWSSDKATDKTFAKIDKKGQFGYFTAAPIAVSAVNTLTFYADGADHSGSGLTIYSVAAAETGNPLWKELGGTVTKAVFDSSFKGYRPTSCAGWFEGFEVMTAVEGLDNVNTSEATSFSFMFYDCGKLTSLNLESFDTAKVKDTSNMFNGCSKLATITVSDGFVMTQVTSSPNMFANCNSLKGGNGTAWASGNPTDKTYAKIDGGTSNPGYFTAKVALAVWNSSGKTLMFYYDVPKKIPTHDGQFSVADAEKIVEAQNVPWYSTCAGSATKVVFDASFAAYRPKQCVKWFAEFGKLAYISGMTNLNVSDAVDLTRMFNGCGKLRVLDLSNFTTSKVTSMVSMFAECSALESIYATEYFTTVKLVPSLGGHGMFHGCTSIRGENGTTYDSSKTDQAYAHIDEAGNKGYFSMPPTAVLSSDGTTLTFYADRKTHDGKATYSVGAALMDEPDVERPWIKDAKGSVTTVAFDSSFRKCRPVHCGCWFSGFTKLTNVKSAKNLTLSSATYLGSMFQYCSALESLYVFAWDTSKVENMKQMFNGCAKLKKVVVSADGFSTASVTESSYMFNGCSALTGGYGTVYDSGKTDATYARGDTKTQKGYFTYPAVARYNSKTLTFYCDGKDHSGSVGIVYDVNDSAYDVEQDWSSHKGEATAVEFDASFLNYRPTSCYGWFTDFSALTAVSGLENLDVSRCEYLCYMFRDCAKLTTLDLTTFDTSKVQEFDEMFLGCKNLTTILASDKFSLASKTSASDMFTDCEKLVGANGTAYATAKVADASYAHVDAVDNPGYFTGQLAPVAVYDDTAKTLTFYYDKLGHSGAGKEVFSVQEASDSDPTSPVVPWSGKTDVTKVVFDTSFAAFQPKHCAQWFMGFSAVTAFVGLENLDVSKATRLSSMFKNCSSLTTLDLSTWNTADVTHMTGMFSGCSALAAIYASPAFTTAKVTTTAAKTGTFTGCTKLPNFDPAKLTADQAYIGAGGYLSEKPGVDTARAIYDATAKTLTFVYDKSHHYGEKSYLVADAEKIDPASEDVPWYADCHETVTKVVFDTAFAGYRPTKLACWFKYFTALTEIEGIENLDTSAASSMKMMFSGCAALAALDVSGFNTANVTDMSYLFWECKALTALDVSSFVTDKVTDMTWMFKDCKTLKTIYAGAGFTAAGADGTSMFHGCSALVGGVGTTYAGQPSAIQQGKEYARIDNPPDAPGFLTIEAVAVFNGTMESLTFYADGNDHSGEGKVYSLAVENERAPSAGFAAWMADCMTVVKKVVFDPSFANFKPKHCGQWFWGFSEVTAFEGIENLDVSEATSLYYMFDGCVKLTELDLTTFKTAKVEDMTFMFYGCKALKTIYASTDFDVGKVTKAGGTFTDCLSLEGGAGTKYDTAHAGGTEYARIDDPDNGKPGYFTDLSKKKIACAVYADATKTLTFYYDNVDHSSEGTVYEIPATAKAPDWRSDGTLAKVEKTVFDVSFADFRPTACYSWFDGAKMMATIEGIENLDTSEVVSMDYMFLTCEKLVSLDLTAFNVAKVKSMKGMFANCTAMTTLDIQSWSTPKVEEMAGMFRNCPVLRRIYTYDTFETTSVTDGGADMFFGCECILGGSGTTYDYPNVGVDYARVDGQDGKPGYFTKYDPLKVTFDPNGGNVAPGDEYKMVTVDEKVGALPIATRDGYVFDGWFTEKVGGTKVTEETVIEMPVTFYAQWTAAPTDMFVVTFDPTDGTVGEPTRLVSKGEKIGELPVASAESFGFKGWFTAISGGTKVTKDDVVMSDVVYYAQWEAASADSHLVKFDANGGTVSENYRIVKDMAKIGPLPVATKSGGATFQGWFDAKTGGTKLETTTVITEDATYYAQWAGGLAVVEIPYPTVASNPAYTGAEQDGITAIDQRLTVTGTTKATDVGDYGAAFELPGDSATETFVWVGGSTVKYGVIWKIVQREVSDADVKFAPIPDQPHTGAEIKPTVTMTYPEGTVRTEGTDYTVAYADNINVGTATATVVGTGNFTATKTLTFKIVEETPKTEVKIDKPMAVVGLVYSSAPQKGVDFDERLTAAEGSVTEATDAKADYAATFPLPTDTETETFRWADDTTEPVKVVWAIAPRAADDEGVAYAEIGDQYYTGAEIEPPVVMTFGGIVCTPGTDYAVSYSNNVEVGTGTVYVAGLGNFSGMKTVDFAIKAVAADTSVVTFDANGGIATETTRVVTNGTAVGALPVAYSYTQEFVGWFTAKEGGVQVTPETVVSESVTFYARWQMPSETACVVVFDGNGGVISTYVRFVENGQPVGELPAATREDYDFVGWFTETTGGTQFTAETPVTAKLQVLHAQWKAVVPSDHVVTFDPDGGTCSETSRTVAHMAPLGELPTATRRGCVFEGWFAETAAGAVEVTAETPVLADMTVRAQWIVPERVLVGETVGFTLAELGVTMEGTSSAKVEGLPKGLKYKNGVIAGVPTETLDFVTQTVFARVTTKIGNVKVETLQPVRLQVDAECLYTNTLKVAIEPRSLGANVKSAKGLPKGLKLSGGLVTGVPTAAGVFIVTLTMVDKTTQTFQWLIEPGFATGVVETIPWKVEDCAVNVMQGVVQPGWQVKIPAGAKVTVSGLPGGLKFDKNTGLIAGTPTKAGNFVVTFKTVLNGVTTTERVSMIVSDNEWTGSWFGLQDASYDKASLNILVTVAANGTVKLVWQENTVKTTATVKNLDASGTTATLLVGGRTVVLGFGNGTMTVNGGKVADLCEAVPSATAKDVTTFVLEEIAEGETNAYAYVTATYNAKKASFALSGKLWDGAAVKGTTYALDKETAAGGLCLAPVLLTDKAKNAVYLELSDNGSWCRVLENGRKIAIGVKGTSPWTAGFAAAQLKGTTLVQMQVASEAVVVTDDGETAVRLTDKELQAKLAANGLVKLTLNDADGWKWVCELLPVENGGQTQFRGIATGTKKGYPTLTQTVFLR